MSGDVDDRLRSLVLRSVRDPLCVDCGRGSHAHHYGDLRLGCPVCPCRWLAEYVGRHRAEP